MAAKGFVGLGIMGKGMAHILALTEQPLVVWNRDRKKSEDFLAEATAAGAKDVSIVDTAAEVVAACGITYAMLSDLPASEAVFPGMLEAVGAGKAIVDCATLTPERMIVMSEAVTAKGGQFLEAPVSGSKVPAEKGALIFLCAGSKEVYDAIGADLDAMGKAKFFFDEIGRGTRMKLVVNMTMGTMLSTLSEGIALAQGADLPGDALLEVLDLGVMTNPMFRLKGPNMLKREYPTHFPLKHAQKDVRFALAMGDQLGVSLPVSSASNEQFKRARVKYGDADFSAVHQANQPSA